MTSHPAGSVFGIARLPGDAALSVRALFLGVLAEGETVISGLAETGQVGGSIHALRQLGAELWGDDSGVWHVLGGRSLREPERVLDCLAGGGGLRMLVGLLSGCPFASFVEGGPSLQERSMVSLITPLSAMGAHIHTRSGGRPPLFIAGAKPLMPLPSFTAESASANIKAAVLLASLLATGPSTYAEPVPTPDHMERLLRHFGIPLSIRSYGEGREIRITGGAPFFGQQVDIPGDPGFAAFPMVAALIRPDSEVMLPGLLANSGRLGLVETLVEMGADIRMDNPRQMGGEDVADFVVRSAPLKGVDVPASRLVRMVDDLPALCVAAALADGDTTVFGIDSLLPADFQRLSRMAEVLAACGVLADVDRHRMVVRGPSPGYVPRGGARLPMGDEPRTAMAALVLGMACDEPVVVEDVASILRVFPGFFSLMNGLGASIHEH